MKDKEEVIISAVALCLIGLGSAAPLAALITMLVGALLGACSWWWPVGYVGIGAVVAAMGAIAIGDKIIEQAMVVIILLVLASTISCSVYDKLPPTDDAVGFLWWVVALFGVLMTPAAFFVPVLIAGSRPSRPNPEGRQSTRLGA